jgi:hypothetical protein
MSHPDPCYDPDNSYEDDDMAYVGDEDDSNYDDYNNFFDEDSCGYHPDADHEIASHFDEKDEANEEWSDDYDDSMDGDHESGLASAGWGTDEDYGHFCDDEAYGFYGNDYDYLGEDY